MPSKIPLTEELVSKLKQWIEVDLKTQRECASLLGVHVTTVENWCYVLHLKTQRTGPRNGDRHKGWKGGRVMIGKYWHIYCPDHPFASHGGKYVPEHRLVMEKELGRYLSPKEVVHHINKNPVDNRPENLIVFGSNADHLRYELTAPPDPDQKIERNRICQRNYRKRKKLIRDGVLMNTQTTDHLSSSPDNKA